MSGGTEYQVAIPTRAGYSLTGTLFPPSGPLRGSMVVSSATGVLQRFYRNFARHFSSLGYAVLTFDYRGIGQSGGEQTSEGTISAKLTDWGANDQAAAVAFLKGRYPIAPLSLVTHSIGGQLLGFNPEYPGIDHVIMVASQSGYWNFYRGWHKLKMWVFWHLMIPGLTRPFGYFPANALGLFENLPGKMALEWMRWGKRPEYMMAFRKPDHYYFERIRSPLLMLSFPADPLAPVAAVDWLADQYSQAKTTRIHYTEEGKRPGHFGFFKKGKGDLLWKKTAAWLRTGRWE